MERWTLGFFFFLLLAATTGVAQEPSPAWTTAYKQKPMTADETRAFMKTLTKYVYDHHLRKDDSPMRGMIYEYFDVAKKGQFDQFVQGEALDTMHDGAWFAAAMVNAYRATGDPFYKEVLTRYQLPFYCKMLNHSDTLFSPQKNDARAGAVIFNKEHALQPGEKGFVPYWWDDGSSVSLERRRDKNPLGPFACTDFLAGKDNPKLQLHGYSHGSSNHLAQDLGVMLQLSWLLLRDSRDDADQKLAREVALAAKNLQECRMRHHGHIPMVDAPAALANNDPSLMKFVPDQGGPANWNPDNHYFRALYNFKPGQRYAFPGFADDQQYRYYVGLAKHAGKIPKALAFRTIYDAFTEPMLYRYYSDDAEVPPGINRFDLHPYYCKDGRPEDYRSNKKGPAGKPRPIGSRMGPQNMVCCGWALQMLKEFPEVWEERYKRDFSDDVFVPIHLNGETELKTPDIKTKRFSVPITCNESFCAIIPGSAELPLKIFARPQAQGSYCMIDVRDRRIEICNDRKEKLEVEIRVVPQVVVIFVIPFSCSKKQKTWINGIQHGRYSMQIGNESRDFYMASTESCVKKWLEHELAGGLRTWEAIFKEKGFIPTGIGAGGDWDRFSDSGGYAHLISAASQWLLYLEGKKDWEIHKVEK
jgi:hypothetical protein